MEVHALSAHNKSMLTAATYAMRLIARLIDDTVTSWLSKDTFHYVTTLLAQAFKNIHFIHIEYDYTE